MDCPRDIQGNASNSLQIDRACKVVKSFRIVSNPDEYEALLQNLAAVARPFVLSFVNAHAMNLAWNCEEFSSCLYRSDIVLRDGIGVTIMLEMLGITPGLNMNGTDFIPQIALRFAGRRVAVCGTKEPYTSIAAAKLRQMGCEVVVVMDGFLPPEDYVECIDAFKPDMVLLGMGMPKQEKVSIQLRESCQHPMLVINGGAILDFLANRFPRAPKPIQDLRLEWLFRMLLEPGRLWKRYLLGGFTFLGHVIQLRFSGRFKQKAHDLQRIS